MGVMYEEYQLYGAQAQALGQPLALPGNPASIANRVSYVCNFHGPSMAIDTMCSSSLTAIHLACQSLQRGGCEVAVAGGVNVTIHPNKYIAVAAGQFVSSKGRCESFGEGGDGYVPGEGVGAVLLKRKSRAIADGDRIYGVIKGTAINHGGKTNGYTVPNPKAQANVIAQALKESGAPVRAISYIEAHGTGTSLGDPIEIAGLSKAFSEQTEEKQFCAIGSAKSNIGHCESAAGIAGVTKVLLQMRHGMLAPSLHAETLNPHIDFANSPFVVQRELGEWKRPQLEDGGERREYPRIAGVSSFGAGGSNAHVVIEEYRGEERGERAAAPGRAALVVLSAKSEAQLKEQVQNLLRWMEEQPLNEEELSSMAYTLQVGREAMEQRLGLMVTSLAELKAKLRRYLEGEQEIEDLYRGEVKRNKETLSVFVADEELQEAIAKWIERGKYAKLLDLWVKGLVFGWSRLYGESRPKRIALPTYPFARERYWLPEKNLSAFPGVSLGSALHPLLHLNTSDLHGLSYRSRFLGEEFFLADNVVQGQRMLPGAAHLEMARAAVKQSSGIEESEGFGIEIRDVVWSRPVVVGVEPVDVHIGLYPQESGEIEYEIYSEGGEEESVVHSQGVALVKERREAEPINVEQMRRQCGGEFLSGAECYEAFRRMGIEYGSGHQGLKEIWQGRDEQGRRFVLGRLEVPECIAASGDEYELHPSIVDAAFQATIGWMVESREKLKGSEGQKAALPFVLESLELLRATPKQGWVILREGVGSGERVQKLDIDLCEEDGRLCARLRGFSARLLERLPEAEERTGTLLFQSQWKRSSPATGSLAQPYGQRLVLLCEMEEGYEERLAELSGTRVLNLKQEEESIGERFYGYAKALAEMLQDLLRAKPKDPVLVQLVIPHDDGEGDLLFGLKGILQTAGMESSKIVGQVIQVEREASAGELLRKLEESRDCIGERLIRYQHGERKVLRFAEIEAGAEAAVPVWKSGGVYLITGGAGGLGLLFAKEIAHQAPGARLVLSGRSVLSREKEQELEAIAALGAEVEYLQADVADRAAVEELLAKIRDRYGKLDGILHSAGALRDGFLLRKQAEEFEEVLSPKVKGVVNLDEASLEQELELFVLFSSISGAFGNVGQADYAAANGFLDEYAAYRNRLAQEGKRQGRTISINWPLWADGGMQMGAARMGEMQRHGFIPLSTQSGIAAFYQAIASLQSQLLVVAGEKQKVRKIFGIEASETKQRREQPVEPARGGTEQEVEALEVKASQYMKKAVSRALKLPMERVEVDAPLEKYGLDSVLVMQVTQELEKSFGRLSKTLLFEYQTVQELTQYFLTEHKEQLKKILGLEEGAGVKPTEAVRPEAVEVRKTRGRGRRRGGAWRKAVSALATAAEGEEVAIIGLSGRYPQARNLREYWENLKAGRDSITEIPAERWDHRLYFDAEKGKAGKSYSKWGGFLEGVDEFDPLFFNISPREAEIMDPQERLFLQCVYEAIEDAGYTRESLGRYQELGLEGNVGVFVGVMYEEYQLYGAQAQVLGRPFALPGNPASIANRVSYVCNFHGPSMAIDTMCSSSLTAIHLACQSLQRGGCEVAVAGGVNVSIHPNKYIGLSQGHFVSSKGRCESFGEGGDGYVPGEGVGAVLLKRKSRAIADGDRIYGVIKGTAINHGGKTNGYSVPNPKAQANVIAQALKESGAPVRAISYIEAHGTGTSLGDPIEIAGLSKAFSEQTEEKQFCAIGSAKSNIGHCESAAGIAGVTKVLLQMRHGMLAPSLHAETLNPHIDFANSPFVVQRELGEWKRPVVEAGGERREYPRIAGVSSFGAGGSNAHVVIEEYREEERADQISEPGQAAPVVLSAKSEAQLKEQVQNLLRWLEERPLSEEDLANVAYTLQVGREAMERRLGLMVTSLEELREKLRRYEAGEQGIEDLYRGEVKRNKETLSVFVADEDLQMAIESWIQKGKYAKLLDLWVKGLVFDWSRLYGESKPKRIALPTYPFARERYWAVTLKNQPGKIRYEQENLSITHRSSFDEKFYDALLDAVIEGRSSIQAAAAKARERSN